ncbi:MAG: spirocyclase AveC family protein [Solirubrobacteraceae bacterium]
MTTLITPPEEQRPGINRSEPPAASQRTPAVMWWATIGALCLAFEIYVMVKWVTGPYFHSVSSGPDVPPIWMRVGMIVGMAGSIAVSVWVFARFVVRPWRREARPSTDGLIVICSFLFVWQDPLSSYLGNAFTYNSWFPNMGSWVNSVPGWMATGTPGHTVPEPILLTPFVYVWLFFGAAVVGSNVMRRAKARWPGLGDIRLVLLCLAFMFVADMVVEGLFMMPLGWFEYAGGHLSIFPHAYNKYPINEGLFAGAWFCGMACLRYFRNDRGETIAERGIDTITVSQRRHDVLRFLAIFGISNVIIMMSYNLPTAIVAGAHSSTWPQALQAHSYFTDGVCGQGTDRACPGPGIPIPRGNGSAYETASGTLVIPRGAKPPPTVPFSSHQTAPFNGPLF